MKVDLWDLPEKNVYVKIKDDVRFEFFYTIKRKYGGAKKLSKLLSVKLDKSYIFNWKNAIRFCPLWVLKKLLSLLDEKEREKFMRLISLNIEKIKSRSKGHSLSDIKFPIRLSGNLARIAGHLVGDGGIAAFGEERYRVYYTNKRVELVDEFINDVKKVFGNVNIRKYIDKRYKTIKIKLPRIIGIILAQFFGLQCRELKHVPKCILHSKRLHKALFLQALFDDDGSIHKEGRKICIQMPLRNILEDVKKMLLTDFNITTNKIRKIEKVNRKPLYELCITSHDNFIKFYRQIKLNHPIKKMNLKSLVLNYRPTYKKGEIDVLICSLLKEKNMTAKELAMKLKRSIITIKQRLQKLEKERTIKSTTLKQNLKLYYLG